MSEASTGTAASRGTLSGDPAPGARDTLSGGDPPAPAKDTLSGDEPGGEPGAETIPDGLSVPDLAVERELGRGGMGVVWLATQESLGRPVAVKVLLGTAMSEATLEKFEAEAHVTGRLEHPQIPPVHTYGRDEAGRPYMCMKLVRGMEWAKLIAPEKESEKERAKKLGMREHLGIAIRVCEALAFAHSQGVIHRDLKPENVMVGEFGEVQVMDWGIAFDFGARDRGAAPPDGKPRSAIGTPAYMPPELAKGDESSMGPWTDVYLLGGILYELLTGAPPHHGDSIFSVLLAAEEGRVEPPRERARDRDIPDMLSQICLRALAPAPADRYQTAGALADAIVEYLQNEASLKLSAAAEKDLSSLEAEIARGGATASRIYPALMACVADLLQARKLWEGNQGALLGLVRARLTYAAFALDEGDLHLAESQLAQVPHDDPRARELHEALRERERAVARRRAQVRRIVALAALLVVAAIGVAVHQGHARRRRARAVALTDRALWSSSSQRIDAFQAALKIDDTWFEGYTGLARALSGRAYGAHLKDVGAAARDLEAALSPWERALEINPKDPVAWLDQSYVHELRGDLARTLACLKRSIELAPESNAGWKSATEVAFHERRYADAERLATNAIRDHAGDLDYFRRSLARFVLGDIEGAREDAEKCTELFPEDEWYRSLRVLVLLAQGKEREAGGEMLATLRLHRHAPHLFPLIAYLAAKHGDLERAKAIEARARAEWQTYERCYLALEPLFIAAADAAPPYDVLGRAFVLKQDLAAVVPKSPPDDLLLRRKGEERYRRGELELAFAAAARALAGDPADGSARLLRSQCELALGDLRAARADLKIIEPFAPNRLEDLKALRKALEGK